MKIIKQSLFILFASMLLTNYAWGAEAWINDLQSLFISNNAIIYELNIRTFNANDINKNGIIEEELGEEKGTFLNAIDRLDELSAMGINTIHVLPITPVGKIKALGTAGSLYSALSFDEINPQLKSPKSTLTVEEEFKKFVDECHNRKIRVIVDMPSCGSYDLYLKSPELFVKDKNQDPVIPSDWTDVRLLDAGDNNQINIDVYKLYENFVDMMINDNVDGIRADVATIKPYKFWQKLISETRVREPQFLFLAEAFDYVNKAPSEYAVFTPYDKLLEAGFDGYYGSYANLKDWKTAQDLYSHVKSDIAVSQKFSKTKSVIGSFATHDNVSPILVNGPQMSKMIIWLNTTLPLNPYYTDGFATGDDYLYPLANKKATNSMTDDDYYFVHRGQLDIFNFSRQPLGNRYDILGDYLLANKFRRMAKDILSQGNFVTLKTTSPTVFAYARSYQGNSIIVMGNLNFQKKQEATVTVPKISNELMSTPVKLSDVSNIPKILKGKIQTELDSGEIQVLYFNALELK